MPAAPPTLFQQRRAKVLASDPKQRKAAWVNMPLAEKRDDDPDDGDSSSSSSSSSDEESASSQPKKKRPRKASFPWTLRSDKRCYLCAEMAHVRDTNTTNQDLDFMVSMVMENIGMIEWQEICVAVSQYQFDHIYTAAKDPSQAIPLSPEKVNEHFREHNIDPRLTALFAILDLKKAEKEAKEAMLKQNAVTDEKVVDQVQLKNFLLIVKTYKELYSWDTTNMNFLCKDPALNEMGKTLVDRKKAVRKF